MMGKQQDAKYYDELWANPYYRKHAIELRKWYPVWSYVAFKVRQLQLLRGGSGCKIVDLGCGPGHLAELLVGGLDEQSDYIGYDFSPVAVAHAKQTIRDPKFSFEVADLSTHDFVREHGVYVATEFLEHVEFDLDVLAKLPADSPVLFSVPTFDDPGHVRVYPGQHAIYERYQDLLDISEISTMADGYRFVVQATRRDT